MAQTPFKGSSSPNCYSENQFFFFSWNLEERVESFRLRFTTFVNEAVPEELNAGRISLRSPVKGHGYNRGHKQATS